MAINSPILNLAESLRQAKKTGLRKSAGNFLKANSPAVAAVSGAINFIRGDRSGLSDTIDNISTPIEERQEQNRTNFKSNFCTQKSQIGASPSSRKRVPASVVLCIKAPGKLSTWFPGDAL